MSPEIAPFHVNHAMNAETTSKANALGMEIAPPRLPVSDRVVAYFSRLEGDMFWQRSFQGVKFGYEGWSETHR